MLGKETLSFEETKTEFLRRQSESGKSVDWGNLSKEKQAQYTKQIEIMQKRYEKQKFTAKERQMLAAVDWEKINAKLGDKLGRKIDGKSLEEFMKNFSFNKLTTYRELRATDFADFGNYNVKMEKVIGAFKSGFKNGITPAMVEALGVMTGYDPWASSGYDRFAKKLLEVVYDLRRKKVGKFIQPGVKMFKDPESDWGAFEYLKGKSDWNLNGEVMDNGEYMVDENGYWVPASMDETMLWNESILEHNKFMKSLGLTDVEYAMRFAVNNGVITRGEMENFLEKRYGPKLWRWMRRNLWVNDPWFIWDAMVSEGEKTLGSVIKRIFSD